MSANVFTGGRTTESVAYDLALSLAAKDPSITTPEAMIRRISDLLPLCREVAEKKHRQESPPAMGVLS
ncbi:hypothetical protein HQN64_20505 [Enterobacteriaceae bacterium BIT-l23]|uniref:hypothetical protein n=1 Tax=Jejubacter sp. L23 TaxID=3092086 RepID=UPI0015856867|nr:hypothetical protein [Enterobacteriaceae bacterium BIT-l23]